MGEVRTTYFARFLHLLFLNRVRDQNIVVAMTVFDPAALKNLRNTIFFYLWHAWNDTIVSHRRRQSGTYYRPKARHRVPSGLPAFESASSFMMGLGQVKSLTSSTVSFISASYTQSSVVPDFRRAFLDRTTSMCASAQSKFTIFACSIWGDAISN